MIKFLDLKKVNAPFEEEFKNAFHDFLNSGQYILGNQLLKFEEEFAKFCGSKFCIGVSSGLDALKLIFEAYKTLGILKEGDEIIAPANTYIASILAISHSKLKPILVEPDIRNYNIDPSKIGRMITKKTKAILGVHLYGQLYEVEKLEKIAKKYNLLLIEDAAQAHGAKWQDGRRAGNLSHAAAFSFYPTKNLGALGDAGAVTSNNHELVEAIKKLRNYGRKSTNEYDLKGYNCRLDELQAAFLRIKLKHLDKDNIDRRAIANKYISKITNSNIQLPYFDNSENHVFHQFIIRSKKRDALKKYLLENGIETLIHYPIPIHNQNAFKEFKDFELPVTKQIHDEVLSLPLNTSIDDAEVAKIISVVNSFMFPNKKLQE